ncbi:MAG: hypothetical protein ACO1TE_04690 [Prosthecobacter sp.]
MKAPLFSLFLLALVASCLVSCGSDKPQRKKVVGPDSSGYSNLPWSRPKPWESTARYGGMLPTSR